jgi:hypothetical protein
MAEHRSPLNGTPLTYVLRPEDEETVTAADRTAIYAGLDDDLVRTTKLEGEEYRRDNQRVFGLLKPLIVNGAAWPFAKAFNRAKDGRGAYLAVKRQAEGAAAMQTRKAKAYAQIATARFTGRGRFNFDQYVARHQKAHNDLLDLGEPVAETKKVTDFLSGITDNRLETGKSIVDGDSTKLADFEACQQYFKTLVEARKNRTSGEGDRKVSAVGGGGDRNSGGGRGQKVKSTKYLTPKEYRKLTREQKIALKRKREQGKQARGGGDEDHQRIVQAVTAALASKNKPISDGEDEPPRKLGKIKVVEAVAEAEEPADANDGDDAKDTDAKSNSAGAQFGRRAHGTKSKKVKSRSKKNESPKKGSPKKGAEGTDSD